MQQSKIEKIIILEFKKFEKKKKNKQNKNRYMIKVIFKINL